MSAASPPLYAVVLSLTNLLLVAYMAVYHLVSNFYLETQIDQFERLFGPARSVRLSTTFNVAFPVGGFIASVPVAALLQSAEKHEHVYFSVALVFSNIFSFLSLLPSEAAQVGAALLFGPVRCLTWACYFQFLATETRYPPTISARAMGYNNVIIAVAGAVGPYLLAHAVSLSGATEGGVERYFVVKAWLQFVNLSIFAFPISLWQQRRMAMGSH